jgi:hypothetical protein
MHRTIRKPIRKHTRKHRSLRFLRDIAEIVRFWYNFIRGHRSLGRHQPGYFAAGPQYVFGKFLDAVEWLSYSEMFRAGKVDRVGDKPRVPSQLGSYSETARERAKSKDPVEGKATDKTISTNTTGKSCKNVAKLTILDFLT